MLAFEKRTATEFPEKPVTFQDFKMDGRSIQLVQEVKDYHSPCYCPAVATNDQRVDFSPIENSRRIARQ